MSAVATQRQESGTSLMRSKPTNIQDLLIAGQQTKMTQLADPSTLEAGHVSNIVLAEMQAKAANANVNALQVLKLAKQVVGTDTDEARTMQEMYGTLGMNELEFFNASTKSLVGPNANPTLVREFGRTAAGASRLAGRLMRHSAKRITDQMMDRVTKGIVEKSPGYVTETKLAAAAVAPP